MGHFTLDFVRDNAGSVAAEHRKIRPLLHSQLCNQDPPWWLLPLKHAAHTQLYVFLCICGFTWLINTCVSTNLPQCRFPQWRNRRSWPDVTKWPLPSFLQFLLLGLDYIQRLISKGLKLTLLAQEVACLVLHGWHPATGNEQTSTWSDSAGEREREREGVQSATLYVLLHHFHPCEFDIGGKNGTRWSGPALTHISVKTAIHKAWVWTATAWNRLPSLAAVQKLSFTLPQASSCPSTDVSAENASLLNSPLVICCWMGGGEGRGVLITCTVRELCCSSEMLVCY